MPWTAKDAPGHTKKASTRDLREMWARIANRLLEHGVDEGEAIRRANAAVAARVRK
jgi:uncharacterized protein YdaT